MKKRKKTFTVVPSFFFLFLITNACECEVKLRENLASISKYEILKFQLGLWLRLTNNYIIGTFFGGVGVRGVILSPIIHFL
jgi:hypothetical protein